jgi:hypothetical protein
MSEAKDKKEKKSVMQLEDVDIAYISDIPMTVNDRGEVSLDIIITSTKVPAVRNIRENTGVAYPDTISNFSYKGLPNNTISTSPDRPRAAFFESLVAAEDRVNAKHFIITSDAKQYLQTLNATDSEYTNKLVAKTNLFCVELESKNQCGSLPPEFKIDAVQCHDETSCAEVSSFQQDILPSFRRLTDHENIRKTKERYSLEAFNSRLASPEISIFTIRREDKLLGAFTLNLHRRDDIEHSASFGYLSDLFVAEGLENDPVFINHFIGGVFAEIKTRFPKVKILSVMAAAGDPTIPIVKCFNHAKDSGLIKPFTRAEQERLGVIAQFTLDSENDGNTHLPAQLPRAVPSHLSVFASNRSQFRVTPCISPNSADTVSSSSTIVNTSS